MNTQQVVAAVDSILYKLRCYKDPQRVRNDVLEALRNYPSLQPRSAALASAQQMSQTPVLYLAGTIPIFYNNVQYNIPVSIWLTEAYPFAPPVCYVTPTPDMIIKPKHRHVDSQGMCYLPYLSTWNPTGSNLTNLITTMSKTFGLDPPVRSQAQSAQTAQPAQPQPQPQQAQPYGQQYAQPPPAYGQPYQSVTPPAPYGGQYAQQPPQPQPSQPLPPFGNNSQTSSQQFKQQTPSQPFEDPSVVAKRNAVRSATEKTQIKMQEYFQNTTKEIDELMGKSGIAEDRGRALDMEKQQLQTQLSQMSGDIDTLTKSFDDITKWLEDNDASESIDIDAVTEPKDSLSKQLLYLVAEDATIEDTLYYLEKQLMNGELNLETFLKNVRSLSTEQFIKRGTIKKIHEKQRQSQLVK